MPTPKTAKRPPLEELGRAEPVLHTCGLRFNGYLYAEARTGPDEDHGAWLVKLVEPFCRSLVVPSVLEEAFAVFFCFQRGAKDYGWFLDRSAEALAGPFLFLHLYREPTPERWRFDSFAAEWDRIPLEEREAAAAIVRRWLLWGTGTAKTPVIHHRPAHARSAAE